MSLQVAESAPKHTDEAPSSGRHASPGSSFTGGGWTDAGQTWDRAEAPRRRPQEEERDPWRWSASAWMLVCVSRHLRLQTYLLIQTAK